MISIETHQQLYWVLLYQATLRHFRWSKHSARPGGHPRITGMREVINAILYLDRTGGQWRTLRHEFPPWFTVWSFYLNSFLVPDGQYLRLYDRYGQMRLTKDEAETLRAEVEARKSQAFAEKLRSLGIDPDQIL